MIKSDLHVHTTYSDGKNTPAEMIEAAIDKGMAIIGISDHAYTPFDESYCIRKDRQQEYFDELTALKERYKSKIDVRIGLELDAFSPDPPFKADYLIGSAHYVRAEGNYLPVDESKDDQKRFIKTVFNGDAYAFVEAYYQTVATLGERPVDIVGHFDLVTKFNEKGDLFDETDFRYRKAWQNAADALLAAGKTTFEINTGAIARGYRTAPYPAQEIRAYLRSRGARFLLSSDSHEKHTLLYAFDRWKTLS